jgi:amino-acid N-acetyltransferase
VTGSGSTIRAAEPSDLAAVARLLQSVKLPIDDLTRGADLRLWILELTGELVGAVGLEGTGSAGSLLRSLAVAPSYQRRGLGQALVAYVERHARAEGIERLVLLTETAQPLFQRLGYEVVERHAVPEHLRQSAEFRSLCPASAVCMAKCLSPGLG